MHLCLRRICVFGQAWPLCALSFARIRHRTCGGVNRMDGQTGQIWPSYEWFITRLGNFVAVVAAERGLPSGFLR